MNAQIKEVESEDVYGVVYKATNLFNGKIYIGITTEGLEKRKRGHVYTSERKGFSHIYFAKAIAKYDVEGFDWEEIDFAKSKEDLNEKEKYWIKHYNSYGDNGYNLTKGGDGVLGLKRPESFARDKSELMKDMWKNGHMKTIQRGSDAYLSILNETDVGEIRDLILKGVKPYCIASLYSISEGTIRGIKVGSSWRHIITKEDLYSMSLIQPKINKIKAIEIKNMILEGKSLNSIAREYDVDKSTISALKRGKHWREVITDEDVRLMNEVMPIKDKKMLNEIELIEIKDLLLSRLFKVKEIAELYEVKVGVIYNMKTGKNYSYLFTTEELEKMKSQKLNPENPKYEKTISQKSKSEKSKVEKRKKADYEITKNSSDLSKKEIIEIKNLLKESQHSQNRIAEMYGVFPMIISRIKNGQIYSDID